MPEGPLSRRKPAACREERRGVSRDWRKGVESAPMAAETGFGVEWARMSAKGVGGCVERRRGS